MDELDDVALLRIVFYGFPVPCRSTPGHVHVRDVGRGPILCLPLEQLAALVVDAPALLAAKVAA